MLDSRACPYFGNGHKNVSQTNPSDFNLISHELSSQNGLFRLCFPSGPANCTADGRQLPPTSGITSKILSYRAESAEIFMGTSGTSPHVNFGSICRLPRVMRLCGRPCILVLYTNHFRPPYFLCDRNQIWYEESVFVRS